MELLQTTISDSSSEMHKNMSRYCNKDIKVISIDAILVTLCQLLKKFCHLKKLWEPPSRKSYQNLSNLRGKYL